MATAQENWPEGGADPYAPTPEKGLALGALSLQTVFSAGTFLLVKQALGTPSQPGPLTGLQLLTLRFTLASLILLGFLATSRASRQALRSHFRKFLLLGFIAVPLNVGLFFEGASRAPAAHAALAYALTPVFVFLLETLAGRVAPTFARVAGLLLALAGALVVLFYKYDMSGPEPLGDLMLIGAAASWGLYTVLSRPLVATLGSRPAMVSSLLLGSAMWLPIGMPISLQIPYRTLPPSTWVAVAYTGLVTTVISYFLWLFALKRLDATRVAIFTNLQPITTVFLAWVALGESLTAPVAIATAFVLAGVTLVQWQSRTAVEVES
jgi:drug/metabolite transporter (DMT)-like permease